MTYETLRNLNWIFDLLCSSIGITAFISLINLLVPPATVSSALDADEQKRRQEKSDRAARVRRVVSFICLFALIFLAIVKYSGRINIEDVFNGRYKYVGQTLNSKADGHGQLYTVKDTLIYEGDFAFNLYDGNGTKYAVHEQEDGTEVTRLQYEGSFKAGAYEGHGKLYYAHKVDRDRDGNEVPCLEYEGEFKNGQYDGEGTLYNYEVKSDVTSDEKYIDDYYISAIYAGSWKGGNKNGYGIRTSYGEDGKAIERYSGEFTDGFYNGTGIWEFVDKSEGDYGEVIYHGLVENGRCSGTGVYYDAQGNVITYNNDQSIDEEELKEKYPYPKQNIWNEEVTANGIPSK